jgi:hypothetical protein
MTALQQASKDKWTTDNGKPVNGTAWPVLGCRFSILHGASVNRGDIGDLGAR